MIMKEYYIFNLKKEFVKLYKDRPSELFYIFNRIYYMKEVDKNYGYNLFEQICNFIDKKEVNEYIYSVYKDKMMYSYNENEHVINNLFLNEISILKVKNSNLRLETNKEDCSFLKDLNSFNNTYFVCDFKNQEFFFLKNNKVILKNL